MLESVVGEEAVGVTGLTSQRVEVSEHGGVAPEREQEREQMEQTTPPEVDKNAVSGACVSSVDTHTTSSEDTLVGADRGARPKLEAGLEAGTSASGALGEAVPEEGEGEEVTGGKEVKAVAVKQEQQPTPPARKKSRKKR